MDNEQKLNELYTNAATVTNTFFDFILQFRRENIFETKEGQSKTVEDVASIRMSPQMAKALTGLLTQNVKAYEAEFGEIPCFKTE